MKSTLCWFSGTGNSQTIAQDLAKSIPFDHAGPMTEIVEHPELLEGTGVLGLVFPIYFFGPPATVRRFILETLGSAKLELDYLFVVFTHGGMPIYAATITDRLLAEAGYAASFITGISMVDTYIPLFRIPDKQRQQNIHNRITQRLTTIIQQLSEQKIQVATRLPFARLFHTLWDRKLSARGGRDRQFVITKACTGCGICAQVCPVDNIVMKAAQPQFNHRCEQCFACYHHCTEHAIERSPRPLRGYSWYLPPKTFLVKES